MRFIKLTQGKVAIVDDTDFQWLNQFKWYAHKGRNTYYAWRNTGKYPHRRTILMHQEIAGSHSMIDHRNGNGSDNRRHNLRLCNNRQNCRNRAKHKESTSRFKGTSWCKQTNKWKTQICHNYKVIPLGYFDNEIEAAKVYDNKAQELFGEFAKPNFARKGKGHGYQVA